MESVYKKGMTMIQPDAKCYRYMLETVANRPHNAPELGQLVDSTLARMRTFYMVPDTNCFAAAIRTWKNAALHKSSLLVLTDRERCIQRIMELLSEMETSDLQSTFVSVKVSTDIINDALEALTASRNPRRTEQAEVLLKRMEDAFANDASSTIAPNSESFIHVLRVWGSHNSMEKVAKAKLLLLRLQERFRAISGPHHWTKGELVDVYNEYIKVCGSYRTSSDKEGMQVFREALAAIGMMQKEVNQRPNPGTYTALLDACENLLSGSTEKKAVVEKIFALCCNDGLVDGKVLQRMRKVATEDQYSSLVVAFSEDIDGTKVVPAKWSANAIGGRVVSSDGRKTTQLSVDGTPAVTSSLSEFKMRRLRSRKNRNLLQGGRLKPPERRVPWRLHDPEKVAEYLS